MERGRGRWLGLCVVFAVAAPYVAIPMLYVSVLVALVLAGTWVLLMAAFLMWAAAGRLRGIGRDRALSASGNWAGRGAAAG